MCAGTFRLTLSFTEEYPNKAPVVKFKSHMFHPNSAHSAPLDGLVQPADASSAAVYNDGGICLDILQNQWSPIYDVSAILTSIQVRPGRPG